MNVLVTLMLFLSVPLDGQVIELGDDGCGAILAPWSSARPAIAVCSKDGVTIYEGLQRSPTVRIPLPEGTSVFDIVDLDDDGQAELIRVTGRTVVRCDNQKPDGTVLFECDTAFPSAFERPVPFALACDYQEQTALMMLTPGAIELRDLSGNVLKTRLLVDDPEQGGIFTLAQEDSPIVLDYHFTKTIAFAGSSLTPEPVMPSHLREQDYHSALDVAGRSTAVWPSFALRRGSGSCESALFAIEYGETMRTVIRIFPVGDDVTVGPARRYPGVMVFPPNGKMPDFNADGYQDLLLWDAESLGASINAIGRIATSGLWQVKLTVHLYNPGKQRYDPRPASVIRLEVPITWLISSQDTPLKHLVLQDLDGDSTTDLAAATTDKRFSIWLWDNGFSKEPFGTYDCHAVIEDVAFVERFSETPEASIGLRTRNQLHIITPGQ